MLSDFFLAADIPSQLLLYGSYRYDLVALSFVIAILSSAMALQVAGMARLAHTRALRQVAFLTGSFALGVGIWSMHFIGMLAFSLCTTISYDYGLTLLSMLPAVLASWVTLNLLWQRDINRWQLVIGGVLVGSGIGAMHYAGMGAMRMSPLLRYDPWWFAASIVVAVVLAMLALWIRFGLRRRGRFSALQSILLGGIVMGCAITGMHYTGMAAARFVGSADPAYTPTMGANTYLAISIALFTITASVFVLAGNALLRYRQLLRQMQSNEAQMRAIVDTAVDGIITIDQHGLIRALNQAAEQQFGWPAAELIGQNINRLMPQPYRSEHDGYLLHYLQTGDARIIGQGREVYAQRRDGSVFPIRLAVGRTQMAGEPMFVGFITDISERVRIAKALQSSEQQYRTLIANMPGVAFRSKVDFDWTKLFISQGMTQLSGWPAEMFLDGSLSTVSIIHPDDLARVRVCIDAAISAQQSYVVEYRILYRGGGERWVSESAGVVYDEQGQAQWIDGVLLDITESKIRAAEHEGIVHAISRALSVVEFDLTGTILAVNDNFLSLTGYSAAELIGQHHSLLCFTEERDSPEYQAFWQRLQQGEFQSGEYRRRGQAGQEIWIQSVYNPILDLDGQPWKVVKLAHDLAERKKMEQALTEARDRAEQAAAAKGMFLANMSHEIRTPMNAILGFTELLQHTPLDAQQARHLDIVRQSARALLGLLNDILDTAKLERGALELEEADFSLRQLCEQLINTFALQAQQKGLALTLHYAPDCPAAIRGDALRLRQILTNLLGNAVKFTEHGQVSLSVECDQTQLRCQINDTGIGIAQDRLETIFAPFTQADVSMARRFGGTGLGTTIARQLAELMGGTISVSSSEGVGSCFTLQLPLRAANMAEEVAQGKAIVLPPLRLLVADDVAQNLELMQLLLQQDGHQVTLAQGGAAAIQAFEQGEFDVVLMDVQMPQIDGLQATRHILRWAAAEGRPAPPVIALTASVLSQDRADAEAAGMVGFASKPVDHAALNAEIARVLGLPTSPISVTSHPSQGLALGQVGATIDAVSATIDRAGALARWGSEATWQTHLAAFVQEYQNLPAELNTADADALAATAHRLRGVAANLGLTAMTQWAQQIESTRTLPSGWQTEWASLLASASAAMSPASAATPANTGTPLPATPELAATLSVLAAAFARGELAEDTLAPLQAYCPPALWQALNHALGQFDFDAALATLQQWQQTLSGEQHD
ncbi:PAS domain S-box protein [Chitinibacter tainanensis]|uniref:PAS domain S-box protein n=1 Tax=Chitinibacter tainanensis TaxID=230667 RepID=UPI0003FDAE9A|nr:PAS domain S-box protein [Chitinibacter tainanensis]